jgi:hypothetical protein
MSCTSISHMLFPKKISDRGSISSSMTKRESILSKGEHSFRGSNLLVLQLTKKASLICFLHAFNVFLFGG